MKSLRNEQRLSCRIEIDYGIDVVSARDTSAAIVRTLLEHGVQVSESRATAPLAEGEPLVFLAGHPEAGDPWITRAPVELSGPMDGGGALEVYATGCRLRLHVRAVEGNLVRAFLALLACAAVSAAVVHEAGPAAPPPFDRVGWLTFVGGRDPVVGDWKTIASTPLGEVLAAYDLASPHKVEALSRLRDAISMRDAHGPSALRVDSPRTGAGDADADASGAKKPHAVGDPGVAGCGPVPDATGEIDVAILREVRARRAVPFSGTTAPARLAELSANAGGAAQAREADGDDVDATMFLPRAAIHVEVPSGVGALSAPVTIPDLSVDRYAALCAELDTKGASPEILRRYEIATDLALQALHAEQARRFGKDSQLRSRFDERRAHFLAFLRARTGGERP